MVWCVVMVVWCGDGGVVCVRVCVWVCVCVCVWGGGCVWVCGDRHHGAVVLYCDDGEYVICT